MRKLGQFRRVVAVGAAFLAVGGLAVAVNQGLSTGATDNLIDHSGFRYGADGWNIESTGDIDVTRTSPGALGSKYALRMAATEVVDVHMEDAKENLPKTKKGEKYLGVVYLRTSGPSVSGALGIRELNGSKVVGTVAKEVGKATELKGVEQFGKDAKKLGKDAIATGKDNLGTADKKIVSGADEWKDGMFGPGRPVL